MLQDAKLFYLKNPDNGKKINLSLRQSQFFLNNPQFSLANSLLISLRRLLSVSLLAFEKVFAACVFNFSEVNACI
jgi:hypothetical protein